ncbi:MAG: hypothetical protein ACK4NA_12875 [Alphaproteobacteria bacterium]
MTVKFANRVKETSDTTGTGTLDLNGAAVGFRSFSDELTSGDQVRYLIVDDPDDPTAYEYGIGTFTAGTPDTLSRDTVEGSSQGGSKVSWLAGTKVVAAVVTAASLGGQDIPNLAATFARLAAVNSFTAIQKWAWGAALDDGDVSTAGILTLGDDGNAFALTGSETIVAIASKGVGTTIKLRFGSARQLTHSADLVIPGGANYTTASGDVIEFTEYASGDWAVTGYALASGDGFGSTDALLQIVSTQTGSLITGTTTLPGNDDSIPQNTEGVELFTRAITPMNASNKLRIDVSVNLSHSSASSVITTALFQDDGADAIAAAQKDEVTAGIQNRVTFTHVMDAGTVSATTFKVRAGSNQAGTLSVNGTGGVRRLGGVLISGITITEYAP